MSWALPGAILFILGLVLLLGYFLSRKVFPNEEKRGEGADQWQPSPCAGCDEAGCGGFATALVRGGSEDPAGPMKVDGEPSCENGLHDAQAQPRGGKAAIRCRGSQISPRYHYSGAPSCLAASQMPASPKECGNACLGFGDCCPTCPPRAIHVDQGLARVDSNRCDGCGECLGSCPLDLIALIPGEGGFTVLCKGPQGPSQDWTCAEGCTACGDCIHTCPEGALKSTESGIPQWIEDNCNGCSLCVEACPQDVILVSGSSKRAEKSASSRTPTPALLPRS
jgi:Fe-S-cluster-containing hydrogenase component 2